MLRTLDNYGPVLWCLSILCWNVLWKWFRKRTSSQRRSTWMFRNETHMLILYLIVSLGALLVLLEMNDR